MEKCSKDQDEKILKSTVVIVDIEGTTTSIGFVKDVLFPYAAQKVEAFVTENWEIPAVQEIIEGLRKRAEKDIEDKVESAEPIPDKTADKDAQIKAIAADFKRLVTSDSKDKHFKELSGLIWEGGYKAKEIKGHLYDDVQPALEYWRSTGRRTYVYSSGSVRAQELLMEHSERGDVRQLFDGNFDTAVGNKQEAQSYKNIITKIGCKAEEALFLTDIVKEGEAAREAGLNVTLLIREGNAPLSDEDKANFATVDSFADIPVAAISVKRKPETPQEEDLPPAKLAKTASESEEKENGTASVETEENGVTGTEKIEDEAMEVDTADVAPVKENVTSETTAGVEKDETDDKSENSSKDEAPQSMETDADKEPIVVQTDLEKSNGTSVSESTTTEIVKDVTPAETAPDAPTPPAETATVTSSPSSETVKDTPVPSTDTATDKSPPPAETVVVAPSNVEEIVIDTPAPSIEIVTDATPVEVVSESISKTVETVPSATVDKIVVANGDSVPTVTVPALTSADKTLEKDLKTETEVSPAEPSDNVSKETKVDIPKIPDVESVAAVESSETVKEMETTDTIAKTETSENGNSNISVEVPPTTEIESKLDDILGEEGAALEKECEETLFKVDKDISSTETLIQKTAADVLVVETGETPVSENTPSDTTPVIADVEMMDASEPVPVVEPAAAVASSEILPPIAEVIPETVDCAKSAACETSKDDTPPTKIEEKSSVPTRPESPQPVAVTVDTKISECPAVAEKSSDSENAKDHSGTPEEKAAIKSNGDSAQPTANGNTAAEERVNGDSCTETKDSEMNGKDSETKDLNGETTNDIGVEEKTNGTSTEKMARGRTADAEIPCEQN